MNDFVSENQQEEDEGDCVGISGSANKRIKIKIVNSSVMKLHNKFGKLEICDVSDDCFLVVNMEIRPEFRGQGHGKRMVEEAKKKCARGNMFASSEENAIGFWEKIGEEVDINEVPLAVKIAVKGFKHHNLKLFRVV